MSAVTQLSYDWHEGFLKVLPAIQQHAKICFRRLNADRRDEVIQETIAIACVNYQLAAARGKLNVVRPGSLADFAVRHVRAGRHAGSSQDSARDAMSPVCQRRHGVEVVSYDRHRLPSSLRNRTDGWKEIALEDRKAKIPDLAAFRVDFARWLQMQGRRDRSIISALIAGEQPSTIADRFGITRGRVSQLRRRYEQEWLNFQGETPSCRSCRPLAMPAEPSGQ